jgi:hypothetical protein
MFDLMGTGGGGGGASVSWIFRKKLKLRRDGNASRNNIKNDF